MNYPRVPANSVSTGVVYVTCHILGKSTKDSSYQLTGVSLKALMGKQNADEMRKVASLL